jgi:thioredoxin reductase (NADPH)
MGRSKTVPGEEALLGRGVSYCATCDAAFFQDQEVLVVGNSEVEEEAILLTKFAKYPSLAAYSRP